MALTELYHGRVQSKSTRVEFVRVFECPTTDLTAGVGGYTATGLPAYGDAYPYGTWTAHICPRAGAIEVDPHEQVGRARITVRYWAPLTAS